MYIAGMLKNNTQAWKHPFSSAQPTQLQRTLRDFSCLHYYRTHILTFVLPLDMSKSTHAVTLPSSPHHIKEQKDTCSSTSVPRILFTTTRLPSQKKKATELTAAPTSI